MEKDPVCGLSLKSEEIRAKTYYQGMPYFFCCEYCRTRFNKNPERYVTIAA